MSRKVMIVGNLYTLRKLAARYGRTGRVVDIAQSLLDKTRGRSKMKARAGEVKS